MKTRTNQPVVANGTPTGEIDKVLGISVDGKIVKGEVSGGTKLYKHTIFDSLNGHMFILITDISTPLDFSVLNTQAKIKYYLDGINVISFKYDYLLPLIYYSANEYFTYITVEQNATLLVNELDDWNLPSTTDTVTEL